MNAIARVSLALVLLSGGGYAATWEVMPDSTGQAINIQAAVDSCAEGDTVLVMTGVFRGDGNRDILLRGNNIVIRSIFGPDSSIIDCEGGSDDFHRAFHLSQGEDGNTVITGLTITGGYGEGAAVYCAGSSPIIEHNRFVDNYSNFYAGGGVVYCSGSRTILRDNIFNRNYGASIDCYSDTSSIAGNLIEDNESFEGCAGIRCTNSFVGIIDNVLADNYAHAGRPPIQCSSGTYHIRSNEIRDNSNIFGDGKGIWCSSADVEIVDNYIHHNTGLGQSQAAGGGIYCSGCSCTITGNTISGNLFASGGGIYISNSEGSAITGNTISGNDATWIGATQNLSETAERLQRRFVSSSLGLRGWGIGGGIFCVDTDSLLIEENTISRNVAWIAGGICCLNSSPQIRNNRIYENRSMAYVGANEQDGGIGGGICLVESSPLIENNTIDGNRVDDYYDRPSDGGGIYCAFDSSPDILRNIISRNRNDGANTSGGIYSDSTSYPYLQCNAFFGNVEEDYSGRLDDQTGINGNFRGDPIFCADDHYSIHILSPCAPGNHPLGEDCGLIGAGQPLCNYISTQLVAASIAVKGGDIVLSWEVSGESGADGMIVTRVRAWEAAGRKFGENEISRDGSLYELVDRTGVPGSSYTYTIEAAEGGDAALLFVSDIVEIPSAGLTLFQNHPNPFNPATVIEYYLPSKQRVRLDIYNVSGSRIARLVDGVRDTGRHVTEWAGRDDSGRPASSGVYFYRLTAGKSSIQKKMILVR